MSCTYHDFNLLKESPSEQVEVCIICGLKKRYRKVQDRVDNKAYYEDHLRDFAQPRGKTRGLFNKFYGKQK